MKTVAICFGVVLAIALLVTFVLRDNAWTCGIGLDVSDKNISMSGTSLTSLAVDLSDARAPTRPTVSRVLSGEIPGAQRYELTFSDNVDWVGVWLDREEIYRGPPIKALDASRRPLAKRVRVEIDGPGQEHFVRVSDQCSVRTLVGHFL